MSVILLLDMDAFFASVEQSANPNLKGRPVIVCGEGRSVATAVSYDARKYGIKTGMSVQEAKRRCASLVAVVGNMDKYVHASLRVQEILISVTPKVEVFSIDECFCDITANVRRGETAFDISKKIQERIYKELKITGSVGISCNKPLAKIASKLNKPNGITEMYPEQFKEFSKTMDAAKLAGVGVGRKLLKKLRSLGIYTVGDIASAKISLLKSYFGINAYYLKALSEGKGDDKVRDYTHKEAEKSVSASRTMPENSDDIKVVKAYMRMICEIAAFRLRKKGLKSSNIYLGIRYGDFSFRGMQKQLGEYVNDTKAVYEICLELLGNIYPFEKPVRLIAVRLGVLKKDDGQEFIFDSMNRAEKFVKAVDEINAAYGEFVLKPASHLIAEKFGIQKNCGMTEREKINKV